MWIVTKFKQLKSSATSDLQKELVISEEILGFLCHTQILHEVIFQCFRSLKSAILADL